MGEEEEATEEEGGEMCLKREKEARAELDNSSYGRVASFDGEHQKGECAYEGGIDFCGTPCTATFLRDLNSADCGISMQRSATLTIINVHCECRPQARITIVLRMRARSPLAPDHNDADRDPDTQKRKGKTVSPLLLPHFFLTPPRSARNIYSAGENLWLPRF